MRSLQITDQLGRQLFYQQLNDEKEIKVPLPNLKSSVYFLTLNGVDGSSIAKKLFILK